MLRTLQFRLALIAIGLAWIGLRVFYWNGYYTEDAPGYVTDAIWMAIGNYHARGHVNGLNVGTYLPVALPIWIFGKSEIALSLWPLACSLLGMVSLGCLSGILFGRPFGLLAALLYAIYPGDVFFSTVVMPDSIQAGWLSFSLFLIVLSGIRARPEGRADFYVRPAARERWILVAAGVAMGVCHLVRANDVLLAPVGVGAIAVLSALWKHDTYADLVRGCLSYFGGWLLVNALEGLAYLWAAGDFFLRFRIVNGHYGTLDSIARAGLNTDPNTIPFSIFSPLLWWTRGGWGQLNQDQAYHALLFCWALAALLVGWLALMALRGRVPERALAGFVMAAMWFSWPLLYHQFGSQSVTHFVPMHRLSRHLVVYAPGAIFATAAGCFLAWEATRHWQVARRPLMAMGSAILLLHVYFNWKGEQTAYGAFQRIKGTYARIREHLPPGTQTLVADPGDLCFFDFWLNPLGADRVRMVAFASVGGCEQLDGGVVLTQSNPGWEALSAPIIQETVKRLPCLVHPPTSWRLLYDGRPEKVYVIEDDRGA